MLAKNAGTSVQILQDFYLKNLEISGDLLENLQIHSVDDYADKRMKENWTKTSKRRISNA